MVDNSRQMGNMQYTKFNQIHDKVYRILPIAPIVQVLKMDPGMVDPADPSICPKPVLRRGEGQLSCCPTARAHLDDRMTSRVCSPTTLLDFQFGEDASDVDSSLSSPSAYRMPRPGLSPFVFYSIVPYVRNSRTLQCWYRQSIIRGTPTLPPHYTRHPPEVSEPATGLDGFLSSREPST